MAGRRTARRRHDVRGVFLLVATTTRLAKDRGDYVEIRNGADAHFIRIEGLDSFVGAVRCQTW